MPRLRSPPSSMSRSNSQVSMRDEMPTWLCSKRLPLWVRLVNRAVICWALRKSITRISIDSASTAVPALRNVVIGSTITTRGWNSLASLWSVARCISRP